MFFRIVRAAGGKGVQHEYVRLVESYREHGKPKQRVVCNLGRKDLLVANLDSLNRLLGAGEPADTERAAEQIAGADAWDWGPMVVTATLWRELGLEQILDRLGGRGKRDGVALSERALVLVANRLCAPSSEHGLARWLETDFVCDRQGRRWVPQWRDDGERRASRSPRVRVEFCQLKQWYRTLDQLHARKEQIEKELFLRLRDLFSLEVDMVFYDLTSTYFEGQGPPGLGAHGYSRDRRPRNRQVLVGLVMVDGWPIAHHVFAGNWRDAKTVPQVLNDLNERFGLHRVVFVGDRGMVTSDSLAVVRSRKQGYLVGLQRRRREEVYRYIERASGEWIDCPGGITVSEKAEPPKTRVQEVRSEQSGVRIFVVHSDERLAYERGQRLRAMGRARAAFEEIVALVEAHSSEAAAFETLALIGEAEAPAMERALEFLKSTALSVRRNYALKMLKVVGPHGEEYLDEVIDVLRTHRMSDSRLTAAIMLGNLGPRAADAADALLEAAENDAKERVRRACMDALLKIVPNDPRVARLRKLEK